MITIRADWTLDVPEEERGIGWAGENEVERRVFVLPEGYGEDWVYRLDLRLADGSADIVLLEPEEGTLTWEITARHLDLRGAKNGYVYAQIRADKGERVKKSSVAQFRVTRSIEASGTVEINPSEIEQAEERMNALLLGAQEAEAGAEEAQAGAEGSAAQAQAAQTAAESARGAAETARDEAEEAAGQTAADREAAGKDRAEVEKLAAQAAADAAQAAADRQAVAGDRLAADEAKTAAEAARDEAQRQAGLAAGSADGAAEAIAAFTGTTLPDAVEQVTEAGAAQAALAEAAADRAEAAAERAEGIDGWTKEEADDRFAGALKGSASGKLVSLADVSPLGTLSRLAALGETIEAGEGEKGPDNPYTLSGAKPTALTVCGRNLFDKQSLSAQDKAAALTQTTDGFRFARIGTNSTCAVKTTLFLPAGTYHIKGDCVQSDGLKGGFGVRDDDLGQYVVNASSDGSFDQAFTIEVSKAYGLLFFCNYSSPDGATAAYSHVQLEWGAAATEYVPYCAEQAIALPEGLELYGVPDGTADEYDALSGVYTRRLKRVVLAGSETVTELPQFSNEDSHLFSIIGQGFDGQLPDYSLSSLCSHLPNTPVVSGNRTATGYELNPLGNNVYIRLRTDTGITDAAGVSGWLTAQAEAGTPVSFVFPAAETAAEGLGDPARIAPPAPVCHIYADAGTVEVAYNRDVNLAMAACEARLAALEEEAAALLGG